MKNQEQNPVLGTAPIAPLDRAAAAPPAEYSAIEPSEEKRESELAEISRQLALALTAIKSLQETPKDDRRGFAMSEAKITAIGMILGPLLIAASYLLDGEPQRWLAIAGAVLGGGSPVGYAISRGMAKSGGARVLPALLAALLLVGAFGSGSCKGPAASTDYVRRDAIEGTIGPVLRQHRQWGARMVEIGELEIDRYTSALDGAAILRHKMGGGDILEPIEIEPAAPIEPSDAPEGDLEARDLSGGTLDPYRDY